MEPKSKYPRVIDPKHNEMLSAFELKFGRQTRPSMDGRWSVFSGISPMASRNCSLDGGRRTSGVDGLSRQISREEVVEAVAEE